jgi:hypothetical protein
MKTYSHMKPCTRYKSQFYLQQDQYLSTDSQVNKYTLKWETTQLKKGTNYIHTTWTDLKNINAA